MSDQLKLLWVGVAILASIALITIFILFLNPSVGDGKKTLRIRFSNIEKISAGTRVTFAGRPVGEVVEINEIFNARSQPTDHLGNIYFYELILKVDSSIDVYNTDEIIFQTSGLLGEKSIAIIPRAAPPGAPKSRIVNNETLYARSTDRMEEALNVLSCVADKAGDAFENVNQFIQANKEEMRLMVQSFHRTSDLAGNFFARAQETDLAGTAQSAAASLHRAMDSADVVLNEARQHELVPSLAQTAKNLSNITGALNQPGLLSETLQNLHSGSQSFVQVFSGISQGEGTLGRLLSNEGMYLQLQSTLSKVDILLNDVNQYGLLFNLDKGWQRERTRRMKMMNRLETPSEFHSFFEQEIARIYVSLNRVGMILDNVECKGVAVCDSHFLEGFKELLEKVNDLEKNLKLYTQSLADKDSCCPCP